MPGIVLGDASSCTNPLLPFFYQEDGFLVDINALRWEVFRAGSATVVASGTVNMDACPDGQRVGLGRYVAALDPSAAGLVAGPHAIVWYYRVTDTSSELQASYKFEVLDPAHFRVSRQFESYVGSDVAALDEYDLADRQKMLWRMSKEVDRLTQRFFFPRYLELRHTVRPESKKIWLDQPIIGLSELVIEESGVITGVLDEYTLDNSTLRVYNRHLADVLSPDDRDNPRITFARVGIPADLVTVTNFPKGELNIRAKGAFGFTDPDGSPFGMVPLPLEEVVTTLALRQLQDPEASDWVSQNPGMVKKARTRDQEIQFDTSLSKYATMTGDIRLDEILVDYMRPTHVGVAG